jgi:hypothetical protein
MYGRLRAGHLAVGVGAAALAVTLTATTVNAAPAHPTTAAERYSWGDPLPEWSDEFDYGSEADPAVPDRDKWRLDGGPPCSSEVESLGEADPASAGPATATTAAAARSTPGSSATYYA